MKHSVKIIAILLSMFFVTQLIGIAVVSHYSPRIVQVTDENGTIINKTVYDLPYGMDPPEDVTPGATLISIIFAIAIAVVFILLLMRYKAEFFLKAWFFFVVTLALGITINSVIGNINYAEIISFLIALPLAALKLFKRNIIVHNITELFIYPGIAAIFVPLLNLWTVTLLLVLISIYDIYAVWHAGFMQKMAQYQIKKLRFFTGFFIPYLGKKQKAMIQEAKQKPEKGDKKIKVNVAILGGGDVIFPIILAGVVLNQMGFIQAILISIGATIALACLFYMSKKGKFYPAMPFISAGCFAALGLAFLI